MSTTHRHTLFEIELSDGRWMRVTATDHGIIALVIVIAVIVGWSMWRRATRNDAPDGPQCP